MHQSHVKSSGSRCWLLLLATILVWPALLPATSQDWETKAKEALENGQLEEARSLSEKALVDSAFAPAAHELLGRIALKQQRNEEAISHFESARDRGRSTEEMEKDWAEALLNVGRQQEAGVLMEKVLSHNPSLVTLRYRLAATYMARGKSGEALPHLEKLYQQGLRHAGVSMMLARAYFLSGQDERAVELLESVARTTTSPEVLLEVGKLLFEHLLYQQALSPLRKAWAEKPGSYEVGMYLGLCHFMVAQFEESEKVLTAVQASPTLPLDYRILLGSVYARLGRREEALRELEKAVNQAPDRAGGYLNLGLFFLDQKDGQRAMPMLDKGARLMAKGTKLIYLIPARVNCEGLAPPQAINQGDSARGEVYSGLARALDAKEQLGSALELFLLALEVDHRSLAAYAGIGKACWELGSFKVAQQFLQKGLELHPREPELHFNLGLVYEWSNQTEGAIRSYQEALELAGPNGPPLYWIQLGRAQMGGGKLDEAEDSFRRGLARDANFGVAHYELGKLYFRRKEYERAEQSFEKALQLDPPLVGAYYEYGLACLRNGKPDKGKRLLETFDRKQALRSDTKVIPLRR